jgi:integrase
MALNLYRRHATHCPGGHATHSMTYEADEHRRRWKDCVCPIYASGTLAGKFNRKNTERTTWPEAKQMASAWETAQSWNGVVQQHACTESPVSAADPPGPPRTTIRNAMAAFLAVREGSGIAVSTMRKYRTFGKTLTAFTDTLGYVMLDQITSADVDVFYGRWELGPRAKGKALDTLRSFFTFCVNREWLTKSPVTRDLKPPLGANKAANKVPFTDEELQRILDACDRLQDVSWTNGARSGRWTGADAKDFVCLLVYTGLRISDGVLFSINRLHGNEIFLRAKKNGGEVFGWIPDWLRDRLVERSKVHGVRPFMIGQSERLETLTDLWRRRINRLFELAGRFDEPPTPHRFRHTFARIFLQRGVPVAEVAELLGDDEKTVRQHYARWVPERQARLTRIVQEAFEDKPKPRLVPMPAKSA